MNQQADDTETYWECNSCGEEATEGTECCEDGEVVLADDMGDLRIT